MTIRKIKTIGNLATFKNFNWDISVKDKSGVRDFLKHNIIYGRNYSGKTTISRIARALENGILSNKYDNPQFTVVMEDGKEINETSFAYTKQIIRVFNEDFVKENLRFIVNPDEDVEPFAVLGEDNVKIEKDIIEIKKELGTDEEEKETGLYKQRKEYLDSQKTANTAYQKTNSEFEKSLTAKATDKKIGIKYKPDLYGDQNYTIVKLKNDIEVVLKNSYTPINDEERETYKGQTQETALQSVGVIPDVQLSIVDLSDKAKTAIEKVVGKSGKIEELTKNAILNKWVQDGFEKIHSEDHSECAFCGQSISNDRWVELEKHFDEESKNFENEIDKLLEQIEKEENSIKAISIVEPDKFYSSFHKELKTTSTAFSEGIESYLGALKSLRTQLETRKKSILIVENFVSVATDEKISEAISAYNIVVQKSNEYTKVLGDTKKTAQNALRLDEVHNFITTISYQEKLQNISELKTKKDEADEAVKIVDRSINDKLSAIKAKKGELDDAKAGAVKVNDYLNHYFGHQYIKFEPIKDNDTDKVVRFEIQRNGSKAYHLSEGEQSLVAFCYFIAKLDDTDTKGFNPIIWIDDPISSLDLNHIFFIYSLMKNRIIDENIYEQLFISTHNLDFLRYIRNTMKPNKETNYFIIERNDESSVIKLMPDYMKKYTTEYIYIFEQIYKCSKEPISEDNHKDYYCFANNARKFLEIYLYYKYPSEKPYEALNTFFADDSISGILSHRLYNDGSHLVAIEKGLLPNYIDETHKVACKIIERLKENDEEQYKSLLKSIGVN